MHGFWNWSGSKQTGIPLLPFACVTALLGELCGGNQQTAHFPRTWTQCAFSSSWANGNHVEMILRRAWTRFCRYVEKRLMQDEHRDLQQRNSLLQQETQELKTRLASVASTSLHCTEAQQIQGGG